MSVVDTWRDIRLMMDGAISALSVTPIMPAGRTPRAGVDELDHAIGLRDDSSSWSLFISYEDASGCLSERRITCKRIERPLGGGATLGAYCHERRAPRAFRVDRIRELIDLSTGEVCDPHEHVERLISGGLPILDRGMATFSKMLVFITLCDGDGHAAEWDQVEKSLATYALRFGGDDDSYDQALKAVRGLSPDARDFTNCMGALLRTPLPLRRQVARLAIDSCAKIVDADGRHAPEELHWGTTIGKALKTLAV